MIEFICNLHLELDRDKNTVEVQTYTARFANDTSEAQPTAWNYSTPDDARKALTGYRHAVIAR
jgi:hypothetical protein